MWWESFRSRRNVSNNIVEAYALWKGIFITKERVVTKIVVFWDSTMNCH